MVGWQSESSHVDDEESVQDPADEESEQDPADEDSEQDPADEDSEQDSADEDFVQDPDVSTGCAIHLLVRICLILYHQAPLFVSDEEDCVVFTQIKDGEDEADTEEEYGGDYSQEAVGYKGEGGEGTTASAWADTRGSQETPTIPPRHR